MHLPLYFYCIFRNCFLIRGTIPEVIIMKMNLLTELICNVLLYSIGFGGLMVVCAVAEGQLSLLPALAIGAVLCFTFNAVAGVRIALRNTNTQKRSVTIAPQPHPQSSTPPLRVMRGGHAA